MTQHLKRYGTLEHVKQQKRILERMIAEMPENQIERMLTCGKCSRTFVYDNARAIQLDGRIDYANGICPECAEKESRCYQ